MQQTVKQVRCWSSRQSQLMTCDPHQRKQGTLVLWLISWGTHTPVAASRTTNDKALDEVMRYKEVKPLPLSVNPLNWWREHEGEYPLLSCQAKWYLCIPGISVPAERIFSTAGDIVTAQRSALKPEHVDQLIFLNKNLNVHILYVTRNEVTWFWCVCCWIMLCELYHSFHMHFTSMLIQHCQVFFNFYTLFSVLLC